MCEVCLHGFNGLLIETAPQAAYATSVGGFYDTFSTATWVRMYEQTGNAGRTCRRCGVSRSTLRKWCRRYQMDGVASLAVRGESR